MARNSIILLLILSLMLSSSLMADTAKTIFDQAGQSFESGDYEKALNEYQSLSDKDYESASLYFNMGNCYFKLGQLGYSILYYMKAQRLAPNDEEISTNLAFARQFMPTRLEGVKINPVSDFLDMIVGKFTLNTIAWLSSILFIVLILLLTYKIFAGFSGPILRIGLYTLLIVLVITSGLTTYKYRTEYLTETGVIVDNEINVYSSPSEDSEVEFVGAFGLTLEISKESDDYYLGIFENKRKGWVKKGSVGII